MITNKQVNWAQQFSALFVRNAFAHFALWYWHLNAIVTKTQHAAHASGFPNLVTERHGADLAHLSLAGDNSALFRIQKRGL